MPRIEGRVCTLKIKYEWTIDNFSSISAGPDKCIASPIFNNGWRLRMRLDDEDYIKIMIENVNLDKVERKMETSEGRGEGLVDTLTSTYKWSISNFSDVVKNSDSYILSPIFNDGWRLRMLLHDPHLIDIELENVELDNVTVSLSISLMNEMGGYWGEVEYRDLLFSKGKYSDDVDEWPFFICRETLFDSGDLYLPDDTLSVICKLHHVQDDAQSLRDKIEAMRTQVEKLKCFGKVFGQEKFSDVTFVVEDKRIPAHKSILTAQSEYFESMFAHNDVEEAKSNEVHVQDVKYEVFHELLRYVYTGEASYIEKYVQELFVAADKYLLQDLKRRCMQILVKTIDTNTVLEYLILSDSCNVQELKDAAMNYMSVKFKDVVSSDKFERFLADNPNLATQFLRQYASQHKCECKL